MFGTVTVILVNVILVNVISVEKGSSHVFWPSLLWVQIGPRDPRKIVRNLAVLEKKGIEVVASGPTPVSQAHWRLRIDPPGVVYSAYKPGLGAAASLTWTVRVIRAKGGVHNSKQPRSTQRGEPDESQSI